MMVAFTALAICTLSCRMAIISWRLYFSTGHWPVIERMRLRPAEPDADAEVADLCVRVDAARIAGDIQTGDADGAAGARDLHHRVEHRGRLLHARVMPVPASLKPDAIDRRIHFRRPDDLRDLLGQRSVLLQIDGFAAEALGLRQPLRNHVADDHHGRAQQVAGRRAGQSDRARARDIDDRSRFPRPR